MNKKFITLCVSALLAGGMVTPAFAVDNKAAQAYTQPYIQGWFTPTKYITDGQYYLIRLNNGTSTTDGRGNIEAAVKTASILHLTNAGAWVENNNEVSQYTLWQVQSVKVNGVETNNFELVNAAGLKLSVDKEGKVGVGKDYTVFTIETDANNGNGHTLALAQIASGKRIITTTTVNGKETLVAVDRKPNRFGVVLESLAPTVMDEVKLNDKFLSSFTIGIGYMDNNVWKNHADEHTFKGNVFEGTLKATKSPINTSGYTFQQNTGTGEVYLWNGDKIVVLTNNKWSGLNNSLTSGCKFQLMTPVELANQEYLDANQTDASKRVIRSYVFKVAEPNVVTEAPLEVAAKIFDYGTSNWVSTNAANGVYTWEELYVSEVDDIYYLTTAASYADVTTSYDPKEEAQLVADYTNAAYVKFIDNNYVNAEKFFGYAWNIVRLSDDMTLNPEATTSKTATEWVKSETIGMTVPEGQWILRENADKDDYEWANRETTSTLTEDFALTDPTVSDRFSFGRLRVTTSEDEYYGDDIYRIGTGDDVEYYKISKAKNAAGVEIDLDAYDEFDYYGAGVKSNSTGVDNTYKIQFVSELTGDPIYVGIDGVGTLMLTNDPTKAINFEADTVKTTDKVVVVNPEDENAYNDVFRIFNTYIGKNDKDQWVDKTDTVSFYRYNFMHDGKYLHFDAHNNKYVLVAPEYDNNGDIDNADEFDTFVIKEKGDDYVNILNVDNHDYDAFLKNDGNSYTNILAKDATGKDYVAGNKLLTYDGSNDNYTPISMMYFDFNFKEARQQVNIYDWEANAQLKLDYNDYNIYRNVAPTAPDTMAIYRTEYQDEFLFEKNGFLGMTVDDRGYNAALFIDTAYVRGNTEKPLFMIGLRPDITPETVYCPIHGVDAGCAHEHLDTIPGYVDADYMTVLADSAAAHAPELDNKFLANSKYTKLSFVAARHNVDTITVAADGHKTTISQNVQHPMVFAFRIVNQETQDFIIEGVDLTNNKAALSAGNPYKTSWMRWNNGVPVMTDIMEDAEVFNIAGDLENANPTANEEIAAEATVSVVATDGAVIVKGAEGKNVIVSTILGKVVANEVLTSDNETIAAPAGIVVVSVDGESFKVAVK